jgi:hypothetical protein
VTEKMIAAQKAILIDWRKGSSPSETVAIFLEIMDDCLGSGDIDYASKLTQSEAASSVDGSPISTPEGSNKKKRRTPSSTPKSASKRKKSAKSENS